MISYLSYSQSQPKNDDFQKIYELSLASENDDSSPYKHTSSIDPKSNVFIQQIGELNNVYTNTQTIEGTISIFQQGLNNKAGLFLKSRKIDYHLTQTGNNNRYLHFNSWDPEIIKVNALQNGNDNDLIIHGENGISEKMQINFTGNNRAIIIRNFN